ncbi:MAG: molybdenum cofactor biosynthesis protein C [Spirochaetes bacterium RBG_16_49_21]|nr:MAG: molybdenum cofactor biosynthesis protein C [Spirochaetes bacterium RBG_16_49_21]
MIDVGEKKITERYAEAQAFVKLNRDVIQRIEEKTIPKGDVMELARIAGILAAKKTSDLIPLCHNISIDHVAMDLQLKDNGVMIKSSVRASAKTGVEMEALVAASTAALAIYDMCKMFGQRIEITDVFLLKKSGGKSDFLR